MPTEDSFSLKLINKTSAFIDSNKVAVESIMHTFRLSEQNNINLFVSVYNVGMSSNVVQADLAILIERYLLCNRVYEKKLYARIMALTILEYLDDVNNLLGRDLLRDLSNVGFKEFVPVFKEIKKRSQKSKKIMVL